MPASAAAIGPFTFAIAFETPFPIQRLLSLSRSSSASRSPVDAPDGTAAAPEAPPARTTVVSRVGKPRESMISRARTVSIFAICGLLTRAATRREAARAPRSRRIRRPANKPRGDRANSRTRVPGRRRVTSRRELLLVLLVCLAGYGTGLGDVGFYTRGEPREGLVV